MKYTISYDFNPDLVHSYVAMAHDEHGDNFPLGAVSALGFVDAKNKLLEKLVKINRFAIPQSENIEITPTIGYVVDKTPTVEELAKQQSTQTYCRAVVVEGKG